MSLNVAQRKKGKSRLILVVASLMTVGVGIYLLAISLTPYIHVQYVLLRSASQNPLPGIAKENRLYIPKIGVDIAYQSGDASVLDAMAWHRYPERGDPEKGGNFILAGHRFELAPTPIETHRKSPFFGIDRLSEGDVITVDFKARRYEYKITRRFQVRPDQVAVEAPSESPKLTLYSCTLNGEFDGREVIEAVPVENHPSV